jgi:hypothetical protein
MGKQRKIEWKGLEGGGKVIEVGKNVSCFDLGTKDPGFLRKRRQSDWRHHQESGSIQWSKSCALFSRQWRWGDTVPEPKNHQVLEGSADFTLLCPSQR